MSTQQRALRLRQAVESGISQFIQCMEGHDSVVKIIGGHDSAEIQYESGRTKLRVFTAEEKIRIDRAILEKDNNFMCIALPALLTKTKMPRKLPLQS